MSELNRDRNLKIWKSVENTDKAYIKEVKETGRRFIAIDAHYQILQATKLWGAFGGAWGVKDESFNNVKVGQKLMGDVQADLILCQYSAVLFYPDGQFPINSAVKISYVTSTGKHKLDDEYSKKVSTNALTKGLSKLGFNADVFMGVFDGNKYEGIENTGVEIPVDSSQVKVLEDYEKQLEKQFPDKSLWIRTMIDKGLTFDYANTVIEKVESFIDANK